MCKGCPIRYEVFVFTGVMQRHSFLPITYALHDSDFVSLKQKRKIQKQKHYRIYYQNGIYADKYYTNRVRRVNSWKPERERDSSWDRTSLENLSYGGWGNSDIGSMASGSEQTDYLKTANIVKFTLLWRDAGGKGKFFRTLRHLVSMTLSIRHLLHGWLTFDSLTVGTKFTQLSG
ncbi:hypothetical protein AV530_012614 [Patagioenas fasciata monilis]|uniref:Uncharacterized protein n=1 Tax=Patagioenas fasciata monilis TaxID=372326 RepID=A0A1V4JC00_PATFA|nr:hypothetical protein AV530_012614 [Patagioenas fasciata monilis]